MLGELNEARRNELMALKLGDLLKIAEAELDEDDKTAKEELYSVVNGQDPKAEIIARLNHSDHAAEEKAHEHVEMLKKTAADAVETPVEEMAPRRPAPSALVIPARTPAPSLVVPSRSPAPASPPPAEVALPAGWEETFSDEHQRANYINAASGEIPLGHSLSHPWMRFKRGIRKAQAMVD